MKILIVDDDFPSRKLLQFYFESFGETEIDVATNGKDAIETFALALGKGSSYDLICLDIVLPDIDGQSVLKEIRRMEKISLELPLSRVKVIMTSGIADSKYIHTTFMEQCEAYLVKPILKYQLLTILNQIGFFTQSPQDKEKRKRRVY